MFGGESEPGKLKYFIFFIKTAAFFLKVRNEYLLVVFVSGIFSSLYIDKILIDQFFYKSIYIDNIGMF